MLWCRSTNKLTSSSSSSSLLLTSNATPFSLPLLLRSALALLAPEEAGLELAGVSVSGVASHMEVSI
jgi:hypothetical protein